MGRKVEKHMEWRKRETECEICGKKMQNASIRRHMEQHHQKHMTKYVCREAQDNGKYEMKMRKRVYNRVRKSVYNRCPVAQCSGGGRDKFGVYRHFCFRHPQATIIIDEDGELPRCERCGMFTKDLEKHRKTSTCKKGMERRQNEKKQDEQA